MSPFLLLSLVGLFVRPDSTDSVVKRLQKGKQFAYVAYDTGQHVLTAVDRNDVCIRVQEQDEPGKTVVRIVQHRIFDPGMTRTLMRRYRQLLPTLVSDPALTNALLRKLSVMTNTRDMYHQKADFVFPGYKRVTVLAIDDYFLQTLVLEVWK